MKKIIISLICIIMVAATSVRVLADGTLTAGVSTAKSTITRGESVVVTVSVPEYASCTGGSVKIEYDSSTFTRSDNKWILPVAPVMNQAGGDAVFAYGKDAATTVSGNIYQFTLTAKSDAVFASSAITVLVKLNSADGASAEDRKTVSVTISCSHAYDNSCDTACNICGEPREPSHSWNGGSVTTDPGCTSAGVKTFTCTVCGETRTEAAAATGHSYDNDCDTECNNGCGTTREPKHSYSTKWFSDGTNHWHQCTACRDKADAAAHTPGEAPTEWSAQTCKVCNHVLKAALGHTHNYGDVWVSDQMGHWYACSSCEEIKSYADHVFDNSCDPDCNTCGYGRQIQHTYGRNWWFDANGHWQECTVCHQKTVSVPHTPGPDATVESSQTCLDCGYEITPMLGHTHDFRPDWHFDDTGHWQTCGCGVASILETHTWDEGTVTKQPTADKEGETLYSCTVCDAEKKESIPMQEGTQPTDPTEPSSGDTDPAPQPKEFPWWILIVAGGVLALGFIIFLIVGAVIGDKQTGRFSNK